MDNDKICSVCGAYLEFHEAGMRKDGSTFKSFWGCKNWKDDAHKAAKEEYKTRKPYESSHWSAKPLEVQTETSAMIHLEEELKAINKRLDGLASFLAEHLK